jgi:DNA-binding response OmpR family regulator
MMAPSAGPRILIADDDPMLRELMILILTAEGYSPHGVSTQKEALDAIGTERWALILLDTLGQGPNDRGYAALTGICQEASGTPVILTTGSDAMANWGKTNPRFADVALKPFLLDWFRGRVADLVASASVTSRDRAHRDHWRTSAWTADAEPAEQFSRTTD